MKKHGFLKWFIIAGAGLVAVVIILLIVGFVFVSKPWPETNGQLNVAGLHAQVKIIRDKVGIPNIYAENEHDLMFAQGYVHAQDRLWQMEFFRRFGSGTVSEILGAAALDIDKQARYFGLRRIAIQAWSEVDSQTKTQMEDYCQGVNSYLTTHRDRLPVEFTLLGINPEPWSPVDILNWSSTMAYFTQRFNHDYEVFRARLLAEKGEKSVEALLPACAPQTPTIIPSGTDNYAWLCGAKTTRVANELDLIGDLTFFGSGAWVIAGKYTETGKPLLANDPHLPTWYPSTWYENGLHGAGYDVTGFSIPGVPFVMVGHNKYFGWGFANMNPDVEDFFIEKLDNVKNPKQYEFKGKWYDLDVVRETIKVKNSSPVEMAIYITQHGPILNEYYKLPETAQPIAHCWSLKKGRHVIRAMALLNQARNWQEFRNAVKSWEAIGQTFVYADVDGNIGLQTSGIIPIRAPGHQGVVPVPGWTGEYEWKGYIPFEEMPSSYNPACGYLFSGNSRVAPDNYPYLISQDWYTPGYRQQRMKQVIEEHIKSGKLFTMEDMRNMQADTYSIPASILRPYMLANKPENKQEEDALKQLAAWDLHFDVESCGASIFDAWSLYIMDNTFNDDLEKVGLLGDIAFTLLKKTTSINNLVQDSENIWFDDVNTPAREKRDDIIRKSFKDALAWLSQWHGTDPAKWQWGKIHTVQFSHTPFHDAGGIVRSLFSSPVYPMSGSNFSINLTYTGKAQKGIDVWASAAFRMILDPGNWDGALTSLSTGECAQLLHPNRDDRMRTWLQVRHSIAPFTPEAIQAQQKNILTLKPQK